MYREPLNTLQIIEYLKRTKEDTTIEEHRMALDASIHVFEGRKDLEISEINIKLNRHTAEDLLLFAKLKVTAAQEELNNIDPGDKLRVDIWKNSLNFWKDIKDAIDAQVTPI